MSSIFGFELPQLTHEGSLTQLPYAIFFFCLLGVFIPYVIGAFSGKKSQKPSKADAEDKMASSFTLEDVKKHNSRDDCWIILNGKVYDVTDYVDEHPGGDAILKNAGGDATEGFHGPQHPTRVFDLIDDFCIGSVVESYKSK